jgi:ABC-type uncharacterized transport system involved in gliding motility auxiliary subunit
MNLQTLPLGIIGAALAVAGVIGYSLAPEKIWLITFAEGLALLCLILFFIIRFQALKTFSSRRSTQMGANSILMVVLFVGILAILNFLAAHHSQRLDFSENQRFTLAPQTFRILRGLSKDITIKAFTQERSPSFGVLKDLLESYRQASNKLAIELIDPDVQPNLAREYGITKLDTVIVTSGPQTMRVNGPSEVEITGAIIRLSKETKKRILFLEGHGERGLEDKERGGLALAKDALAKQGYDVAALSLLQETSVPIDAAALIVAGPKRPITKEEQERITSYVAKGGRLLLMLDPESQRELDSFLKKWGIEMGAGVVIDFQDRLAQGSPTFLLARRFVEHDITRDLKSFVLFPESRYVKEAQIPEWEFLPLVQTSPQSRAVTNSKGGVFALNEKEDIKGPLSIAAVVTPKKASAGGQPQPAVVVIGNSLFASNVYLNFLGNPDFFLNTVSWLSQEPELISITPKDPGFRPFLPNPLQEHIVLFLQVLALPLFTFVAGIMVWRKRRRL